MRKSTKLQLSIPEPCSQNLAAMPVNETGRFCESCNKSVVDFTDFSDQQLIDFFQKSKGKICGQFRIDQLEKPLYISPSVERRHIPTLLISTALAMGAGNSVYAQGTHTDPTAIHASPNGEKEGRMKKSIAGSNNIRLVSGKVIDKATKEELPGTGFRIEGSEIGVAADANGFFKLMIPHHLLRDTVKLIVSCYGYETKTVNVMSTDFPYHTLLELERNIVNQETVNVVASSICHSKLTIGGGVCVVTTDVDEDCQVTARKKSKFRQRLHANKLKLRKGLERLLGIKKRRDK